MIERKVKILLLAPPPDATGGIARWTRNILNYYWSLGNEGQKIELVFFPMGRSKFINPSTPFLMRLVQGISDYSSFLVRLVRFVSDTQPSVVHIVSSASLGLFKDVVLQWFFKIKGINNIIHFRFGRIPDLAVRNNWEWKVLKRVVAQSDLTVVLDQDSYKTLEHSGFMNIDLIPNPLSPDISRFISDNRGIDKVKNRILFAGQMLPTKGVFELIEACLDIPNIDLIMVGKLPEGMISKLESLAERKGDSSWLEIRDEVTSNIVLHEMLSADVFVLPSYTEGFPNVILEAMACGCSIVSTHVGAIPQMLNIDDPKNACGICVDPKDVSSLRTAIIQLLDDPTLAESLALSAQKRVEECYDMEAIWKRLNTIWLEF